MRVFKLGGGTRLFRGDLQVPALAAAVGSFASIVSNSRRRSKFSGDCSRCLNMRMGRMVLPASFFISKPAR